MEDEASASRLWNITMATLNFKNLVVTRHTSTGVAHQLGISRYDF